MNACIYHEADLDGVMSAAIVKRYSKEKGESIDLIPYNYGKEIPDVNKYDKVFVVDVSFGERTVNLFWEWEDDDINVVWIDHHKSAINSAGNHANSIKGKRRVGTAACELAWEYFFDDRPTPYIVKMLSAYDVWDHDHFEWSDVVAFQYGMRGHVGLDPEVALDLLERFDDDKTNENKFVEIMIENGEVLIEYIYEKNKSEVEMFSFEAEIAGHKAICMNTTEFNSATFESIYDPNIHDLMMPFCWNGRFFRCSLYTTKEDLDCSAVARSASPGGGGHKQAAGFQLPMEEMMEFLKTRKI